jgi:phosphohistidine phosphatase
MLTLLLLRHAKSCWDDPDLDDFDRPLAKRGAKAADLMGDYIESHHLKPELVLCSSAVRARGTLALILPHLRGASPEVVYEDELYLASPTSLLGRLRGIEAGPHSVMLLGHNPGLQALALELVKTGEKKAISQLAMKFPTCGLAVIKFETNSWKAIRPASGKLHLTMAPRRLA